MYANESTARVELGTLIAALDRTASPEVEVREDILSSARDNAELSDLAYGGSVTPPQAWELFSAGKAVIVDVRTAEERSFVGRVPGTLHVPWVTGVSMEPNPRFVHELHRAVTKYTPVLFLCRSGKRSAAAAEAAAEAGYRNAFNIREGFEGDLDAAGRRGTKGGWRHHGLPWVQD
ncbi:MAG TPA: rhodanese-like domain-containing protein [Burkholderiales bacterium]|nr:rhodanese-like domain-containing protein [Burkholderiales bacterium]